MNHLPSLTIWQFPGRDIDLAPGDGGKVRVSGVIQAMNSSAPLKLSGGNATTSSPASITLDPGFGRYIEIGGKQPTISSATGKDLVIQTQVRQMSVTVG